MKSSAVSIFEDVAWTGRKPHPSLQMQEEPMRCQSLPSKAAFCATLVFVPTLYPQCRHNRVVKISSPGPCTTL